VKLSAVQNCIRISYAASEANIEEALERIKKSLT